MRKLFLFLLILIPTFAFSAEYSWHHAFGGSGSSSPSSACNSIVSILSTPGATQTYTYKSSTSSICTITTQNIGDTDGVTKQDRNFPLTRIGDSCPPNSTYDPLSGCVPDSVCPAAGTNKLVAFTCDCSGKYCVQPKSFSFEGCGFEKNLIVSDTPSYLPVRDSANPANSTCFGIATSTGEQLAPSDSVEEVCPTCISDVPDEGSDQPSCVTVNAHEFCPDAANPACGTRDGNPYCFNESDACGEFNGQMMCIPSSGGRTCSYAAGQYTCVDKNTGKVISSTSSDHPSNGGNADGNDANDPQAPGSVTSTGGGSPQGSDEAATNKAITDLQGALTDRLDGISDLLGEGEPTAKNINAPTETGSLDLDDWDKKIADAKIELKQSSEGIGDLMNAANNWIITGSGGSLSCFVEDWGRMCLADYQDQLIGIRYVLIFMASILAVYIIFIRD